MPALSDLSLALCEQVQRELAAALFGAFPHDFAVPILESDVGDAIPKINATIHAGPSISERGTPVPHAQSVV